MAKGIIEIRTDSENNFIIDLKKFSKKKITDKELKALRRMYNFLMKKGKQAIDNVINSYDVESLKKYATQNLFLTYGIKFKTVDAYLIRKGNKYYITINGIKLNDICAKEFKCAEEAKEFAKHFKINITNSEIIEE